MWARLDKNNIVREIIDFNPSGKYHPDIKWVECEHTVKPGMLFDNNSKMYKELSEEDRYKLEYKSIRKRLYLNKWPLEKQNEALIDKINGDDTLYNEMMVDFEEIKKRIYDIKKHVLKNTNNPPNVYVIHGELTDEEMNHLYNHPKIKAHLNLTKGEGFGRPLLEASLSKKPIIASNWSGHLDFLRPRNTLLVGGTITKVHPSAIKEQGIMEQAQWFSFYYDEAKSVMKEVVKNYKKYKKLSESQSVYNSKNYTLDKMTEQLSIYLEKYVNLPDLKYTDLPELKEIKLPKIKKTKLP